MKLETLTREQVHQVRIWRNLEPQFLRTPYQLTEQMQDDFFDNVVNNREAKHKYFALMDSIYMEPKEAAENGKYGNYPEDGLYTEFIGMAGLTNIEWENGAAEISLIINPEYRKQGKGKETVDLILKHAFEQMGLYSVYGEVYNCGNVNFWRHVMEEHPHYWVKLVDRKFYNGKLWDSIWFAFNNNKDEEIKPEGEKCWS